MLKKLTPEQQAEILQTGIQEFSRLGFDKANVNVIAKKAGVSIGVLYKYSEDKNSFFLACVRHALESLDEVLTARIDAGRDPEENAETLIRAAVEFSREHPETVILYHRITSLSGWRHLVIHTPALREGNKVPLFIKLQSRRYGCYL